MPAAAAPKRPPEIPRVRAHPTRKSTSDAPPAAIERQRFRTSPGTGQNRIGLLKTRRGVLGEMLPSQRQIQALAKPKLGLGAATNGTVGHGRRPWDRRIRFPAESIASCNYPSARLFFALRAPLTPVATPLRVLRVPGSLAKGQTLHRPAILPSCRSRPATATPVHHQVAQRRRSQDRVSSRRFD